MVTYEILDRRFARLINASAKLDLLDATSRWAEGPVYVPAARHLLWSDIPNDRMMRWDEGSGHVSVFRSPSQNSNGNTLDRQGRLVTCEHLTRRVTRTEHDGSVTVIADRSQDGKRFNSPNDVVVASDGAIWFTDPTYGIDSDYEGRRAPSEIGRSRVYRVDPSDASVRVVADDFVQPNGVAFSPDERRLYVSDTGRTHVEDGPAHIRVFDVDDGSLTGGEVFAESPAGLFDGFRLDEEGNVWTSAGDGVRCYEPEGNLIGFIRLPDPVANVCFGGPARNRLFICATGGVYAVYLRANGVKLV
ncbi:MAG: SMP-30/gluconolactonase/LRE family protein [Chloroflexota bacterium]